MVFQPHRNQAPSQPPLSTQYFDFASAQTHMLWTSLLNHIAIPQRTGRREPRRLIPQRSQGMLPEKSVLELGLERWGQC